MQTRPTVSVIIPAYNEEGVIEGCLRSCLNQTVPFKEIIVVNNMSTDRTEEIVRSLQEEYPIIQLMQQNEAQGLLPTRDMGLNAATADILGRIDADATLSENWVEAVQEAFLDDAIAATSGPVLYRDMPLQKVGLKMDEKIRGIVFRMAKDYRFLFGTNMAIRRSAWYQIRDLIVPDPNDEHHEDISIALTLFRNGLEIAYVPDMVAGMSVRRLDDSPREFYRYIMRFENTFRAYDIKSATARIPMIIYLLTYFPARTIRKFYDDKNNKFTLRKLREDIEKARVKI